MTEHQYSEKQEKLEKEEEKQEKEEKSWDEKWRRDPVSAAVWALILIWAGVVLLVSNLGLLDRFEQLDAWGLVFVGAGLIILLEVAFRLLVPSYRQSVSGTLVLAVVFLAIGLGNLINWGVAWALALIVIGVFVLARGLFRWR
jgi:hypothetical protein